MACHWGFAFGDFAALFCKDSQGGFQPVGDLDDITRKMLEECNYNPEETENIIASELSLESDYIFDILGV